MEIFKDNDLLNKINEIENVLKNIRYCEVIVMRYKSISISFMEYITKKEYTNPLELTPLIVYTVINNDQLLIDNKSFQIHIHDIYCDMMNKYINNEYYKRFDEEYISTEAKLYKIYIFRITAEKKLHTLKSVDEYNKELEDLLKKYIMILS